MASPVHVPLCKGTKVTSFTGTPHSASLYTVKGHINVRCSLFIEEFESEMESQHDVFGHQINIQV